MAAERAIVQIDQTIICRGCQAEIPLETFIQALKVCSTCDAHAALGARERLDLLIDRETFVENDTNLYSINPLNFPNYESKLERDTKKTKLPYELLTGEGEIGGHQVNLAIGDVGFIGGTMGSVAGEKLTRTIERATQNRLPLITVSVSGGMRMQEGALALMQMQKTAAACVRHSETGLFYISVVTDPTYGGATASFVSLGHVIIAEPYARIGFAGPRAVASIHEQLPDNFQKSEFLLEHGMIDYIVHRHQMRSFLVSLLDWVN